MLRGRLYRQSPSEVAAPAVAMALGFTVTIEMVPWYAEAFASAGLTVLLFDNAGFGLSDGEPRREVELWRQVRGYLAAASFLRDLDDVDPDRIAFHGSSTSAATAIIAAAVDGRVAALVAQVPRWGTELTTHVDRKVAFERLRDELLHAELSAWPKQVSGPLPVVSSDQQAARSFTHPETSYRWFTEFGSRPGTGWVNEATYAELAGPVPLDVRLCIPEIRAPTMVVTAAYDEMCDAEVARTLTDRLGGPVETLMLDGGHFGSYYPETPAFEAAMRAERAFLLERLAASTQR